MIRVSAIGNLGRDLELKKGETTAKSYVDFSIAVEEYDGKDDSGKSKFKTNWWGCRLFGQQAEYASAHAKKGNTVYVEGSPSVNVKDGKTYLNIRVQNFLLVSRPVGQTNGASAPSSNGTAPASTNGNSASAADAAPEQSRGAAAAQRGAPTPVAAAAAVAIEEDDLPF
jgi:single stranded DNA-binding protein